MTRLEIGMFGTLRSVLGAALLAVLLTAGCAGPAIPAPSGAPPAVLPAALPA